MDLLKLLIADDEASIRNGLKCILDWEELGYKLCGEASNGKDAVEQINNLRPDLVILDIKMPGLTGIEVMSNIRTYYKENKLEMPAIIVLSGFSDFEYAKESINNGAKAYLLKPVDEDELQEKVISLGKEIRERQKLNETSKNAAVFVLKDYLWNIFQTKKVPEQVQIYDNPFLADCENSNYCSIVLDLNFCTGTPANEILKSVENYFSFFKTVIIPKENKILILLKASNEVAIENCIQRAVKLNKKNRTFICRSQSYTGLEGLLKSYYEAEELCSYLFFISDQLFISKNCIEKISLNTNSINLQNLIDDIVFCIETYNKDKLEKIISLIKENYFDISKTEAEIKKQFISCMVELRNKLLAKYPEREISNGTTFEVIPKILEAASYSEIIEYVKSVLFDLLENFNFNTSDSVIVKVIAYVKSNYDQDLKLEALGDMFNCNSAYLGKKFKKYTGTQFNTYLDNLRIEDAKDKLLHSDLKIYQISKLVGYANTDYFFMKFKKCTGCTPKEFKKAAENEKK